MSSSVSPSNHLMCGAFPRNSRFKKLVLEWIMRCGRYIYFAGRNKGYKFGRLLHSSSNMTEEKKLPAVPETVLKRRKLRAEHKARLIANKIKFAKRAIRRHLPCDVW
ncbi:hypothetical protein AB6A40_005621 [Gnathostoma spinigerum]|uniref:Uncharacterized protein n=1 Tax=Gnathostoma spinigerum TaxID=75299 RepID=A0ABD6EI59_9BILA